MNIHWALVMRVSSLDMDLRPEEHGGSFPRPSSSCASPWAQVNIRFFLFTPKTARDCSEKYSSKPRRSGGGSLVTYLIK